MTTDNNQELRELLRTSPVTVLFKKKDGTTRTMHCTLKSDLLPTIEKKNEDVVVTEKKQNQESIAIWDLEKKAWRSFRFDSIISYTSTPF